MLRSRGVPRARPNRRGKLCRDDGRVHPPTDDHATVRVQSFWLIGWSGPVFQGVLADALGSCCGRVCAVQCSVTLHGGKIRAHRLIIVTMRFAREVWGRGSQSEGCHSCETARSVQSWLA